MGKTIYSSTTTLAGLIVLLVVANYIYTYAIRGEHKISVAALILAGVVWLGGWLVNNILSRSN